MRQENIRLLCALCCYNKIDKTIKHLINLQEYHWHEVCEGIKDSTMGSCLFSCLKNERYWPALQVLVVYVWIVYQH